MTDNITVDLLTSPEVIEIPGASCHYDGACEECGNEVDNGDGCGCACHTYV